MALSLSTYFHCVRAAPGQSGKSFMTNSSLDNSDTDSESTRQQTLLNMVQLVSKSEPWFLLGIVNFTIDYNQFRHWFLLLILAVISLKIFQTMKIFDVGNSNQCQSVELWRHPIIPEHWQLLYRTDWLQSTASTARCSHHEVPPWN